MAGVYHWARVPDTSRALTTGCAETIFFGGNEDAGFTGEEERKRERERERERTCVRDRTGKRRADVKRDQ